MRTGCFATPLFPESVCFRARGLSRRRTGLGDLDSIVDSIRVENHAITDRSVDVQIVNFRKKMGEQGNMIETVRGVGYRFKENLVT